MATIREKVADLNDRLKEICSIYLNKETAEADEVLQVKHKRQGYAICQDGITIIDKLTEEDITAVIKTLWLMVEESPIIRMIASAYTLGNGSNFQIIQR